MVIRDLFCPFGVVCHLGEGPTESHGWLFGYGVLDFLLNITNRNVSDLSSCCSSSSSSSSSSSRHAFS